MFAYFFLDSTSHKWHFGGDWAATQELRRESEEEEEVWSVDLPASQTATASGRTFSKGRYSEAFAPGNDNVEEMCREEAAPNTLVFLLFVW